jgi:type IV secretory pathway TrbL component
MLLYFLYLLVNYKSDSKIITDNHFSVTIDVTVMMTVYIYF